MLMQQKDRDRPRVNGKSIVLILSLIGLLALLYVVADRLGLGRQVAEGRARIIDGDSFFLGAYEVRLVGIDAPEGLQMCQRNGMDWACGEEAKRVLRRLTAGHTVRCEGSKQDQHGRLLARCFVGETNINAAMVEAGFALAFGDYGAEESAARDAKRGMWVGTFERPQAWRERNRAPR